MKIKGWDKLRYKSVFICGMALTIPTTYNTDEFYILEFDDADDVGNTLLKVTLEAKEDEFWMTSYIVPTQIHPNIKRVFRRKDIIDMDYFLLSMCEELKKNGMVNSYLTLMAELQKEKFRANLPF